MKQNFERMIADQLAGRGRTSTVQVKLEEPLPKIKNEGLMYDSSSDSDDEEHKKRKAFNFENLENF